MKKKKGKKEGSSIQKREDWSGGGGGVGLLGLRSCGGGGLDLDDGGDGEGIRAGGR